MKENAYIHLLKNRNFISFWTATTLLRLASNILQFALAIYVLDLTGSGFVYSTVLAIIIVPRIFCSSIAGYIADYKDSIKTIQAGSLVLTALMALFGIVHVFIGPLNILLIYFLVTCLELCETFLSPSEGKAILSIVEKEEIAPASKMSSLDDGIVEILSPLVAAFFYERTGLSSIFVATLLLEGIAFVLAMMIRSRYEIIEDTKEMPSISVKSIFHAYYETLKSLKQYPCVIGIMLFAPLFNFFVAPLFSVTAPHFFRVTMMAEVDAYAMFNTILGIAGLCAPFLAMVVIDDRSEYRTNKAGTVLAMAVLLGLIAFFVFGDSAITDQGKLGMITVAMALLMVIITIMNIATSISMKKYIPEQILGRVLSIIQLCAVISVPLGQLFYGLCSDRFPMVVSLLISLLGLLITFIVMSQTYHKISK